MPNFPRAALVLTLALLAGPGFLATAQAATLLAQAADAPEIGDRSNLGDFNVWLAGVRAEALEKGISEATVKTALSDLKPIPRIIELDRKQPEFTLTLTQYLNRVVPASRVKKGRAKLAENIELLTALEARYGVPGRYIVAFWGIETDFGRISGGFSVIAALATLAHDGRRSAYFRKELMNALKIIDDGHITSDKMSGSWAGAMGQTQFMPSTFLSHATDYNGDDRIDIWNTRADALASGANYLKKAGWNPDLTWGREVRLPENFDATLASKTNRLTLAQWQALGVTRVDGGPLPQRDGIKGRIVLPESKRGPKDGKGRAFLVYDNFDVILDWNRSNFFAIAVGQLADQIKTR